MFAHVSAVVGLEGLVVAVASLVHNFDERTLSVVLQQLVPARTPNQLDDVPAGATEEGLQLLDDLAIAANRAVKALQVAVDDERQVIQALICCHLKRAASLRLIHLAVAQECPDVLVAGVLDTAILKVFVERSLINRVDGADAHGHSREFPEVPHLVRMRIARQTPALSRTAVLLAEAIEIALG